MNNIILKGIGGFYYVKTRSGEIIECKAKGKFRNLSLSPLAGDFVDVDCEESTNVISKIYPRKNKFLRPAFANLDLLVLVVSATQPQPNYLVIDKICAIAQYKSVEVVIVITKTDIAEFKAVKDIYEKAGFEVFSTYNHDTGSDDLTKLNALKEKMSGKLSAFSGNSGVGKSTLINKLFPTLSQQTNEISQKLGRGKHTTREVEIFDMGFCMVADTPGFSSIELSGENHIPKEELGASFIDFLPYIDKCKFTDCSHTTEKGCMVLQMLSQGAISRSRHNSYVDLYEIQKNIKSWEIR